MISIVLSAICITACLKWGAWKRWREFYPTILYLIAGNLVYCFVFRNYMLWDYNSFIGETYVDLINIFLIYPPAVILYLTYFPKGKWKQAGYALGWAAAGTVIEIIAFITGGIVYWHGWNIFYSFLLLLGLFIFIRLHYKNPLVIWPVSFLCGLAVALIFGLPPPE